MTSFVIDASATAPLLFADEAIRLSPEQRDRMAEAVLTAPRHWLFETANMVLIAERRGRIAEAERPICISILRKLGVKLDDESDEQAWSSSLELARAYNLSLYDAAYLEQALRTGQGLLTFDTDLSNAARACSIETPLLP